MTSSPIQMKVHDSMQQQQPQSHSQSLFPAQHQVQSLPSPLSFSTLPANPRPPLSPSPSSSSSILIPKEEIKRTSSPSSFSSSGREWSAIEKSAFTAGLARYGRNWSVLLKDEELGPLLSKRTPQACGQWLRTLLRKERENLSQQLASHGCNVDNEIGQVDSNGVWQSRKSRRSSREYQKLEQQEEQKELDNTIKREKERQFNSPSRQSAQEMERRAAAENRTREKKVPKYPVGDSRTGVTTQSSQPSSSSSSASALPSLFSETELSAIATGLRRYGKNFHAVARDPELNLVLKGRSVQSIRKAWTYQANTRTENKINGGLLSSKLIASRKKATSKGNRKGKAKQVKREGEGKENVYEEEQEEEEEEAKEEKTRASAPCVVESRTDLNDLSFPPGARLHYSPSEEESAEIKAVASKLTEGKGWRSLTQDDVPIGKKILTYRRCRHLCGCRHSSGVSADYHAIVNKHGVRNHERSRSYHTLCKPTLPCWILFSNLRLRHDEEEDEIEAEEEEVQSKTETEYSMNSPRHPWEIVTSDNQEEEESDQEEGKNASEDERETIKSEKGEASLTEIEEDADEELIDDNHYTHHRVSMDLECGEEQEGEEEEEEEEDDEEDDEDEEEYVVSSASEEFDTSKMNKRKKNKTARGLRFDGRCTHLKHSSIPFPKSPSPSPRSLRQKRKRKPVRRYSSELQRNLSRKIAARSLLEISPFTRMNGGTEEMEDRRWRQREEKLRQEISELHQLLEKEYHQFDIQLKFLRGRVDQLQSILANSRLTTSQPSQSPYSIPPYNGMPISNPFLYLNASSQWKMPAPTINNWNSRPDNKKIQFSNLNQEILNKESWGAELNGSTKSTSFQPTTVPLIPTPTQPSHYLPSYALASSSSQTSFPFMGQGNSKPAEHMSYVSASLSSFPFHQQIQQPPYPSSIIDSKTLSINDQLFTSIPTHSPTDKSVISSEIVIASLAPNSQASSSSSSSSSSLVLSTSPQTNAETIINSPPLSNALPTSDLTEEPPQQHLQQQSRSGNMHCSSILNLNQTTLSSRTVQAISDSASSSSTPLQPINQERANSFTKSSFMSSNNSDHGNAQLLFKTQQTPSQNREVSGSTFKQFSRIPIRQGKENEKDQIGNVAQDERLL